MAIWQRKLNIADIWKQAEDRTITAQQLAAGIADRLEKLKPLGDVRIDSERDDIVSELLDLAGDESADFDDFDCVMESLYDWADTALDSRWNGRKVCWIERWAVGVEV